MTTDETGYPKWKFVIIGFALIAAFYLLREHYNHVLGYLPYVLLLACPLMHLFGHGHGGHGKHHSQTGQGGEKSGKSAGTQ
jgi:hypothetical protein